MQVITSEKRQFLTMNSYIKCSWFLVLTVFNFKRGAGIAAFLELSFIFVAPLPHLPARLFTLGYASKRGLVTSLQAPTLVLLDFMLKASFQTASFTDC